MTNVKFTLRTGMRGAELGGMLGSWVPAAAGYSSIRLSAVQWTDLDMGGRPDDFPLQVLFAGQSRN